MAPSPSSEREREEEEGEEEEEEEEEEEGEEEEEERASETLSVMTNKLVDGAGANKYALRSGWFPRGM
ncbi:hypothetical protein [Streptomyces sp. NPDC087525]|uniref:hypothetical protein n=1 Tax=Streptomyces sp. NPDC087525 TaxID=3365793 RepID=UPI0038053EBF